MCVLLTITKTEQRLWKLWARTHKYFHVEKGFNINEVSTRLGQPYARKLNLYYIILRYVIYMLKIAMII